MIGLSRNRLPNCRPTTDVLASWQEEAEIPARGRGPPEETLGGFFVSGADVDAILASISHWLAPFPRDRVTIVLGTAALRDLEADQRARDL
jgi:hypothetical protein